MVAISANVSGNARIDAVVAYVDTANPGADDNDGALVFTAVEGTPAGSPTAPGDNDIQTDLGAGVRWHRLANVTVANGFATITNANIADTRDRTFIESAKVGGTQAYADTISEFTAAAGVTVDSLLIKDGGVRVSNETSVSSLNQAGNADLSMIKTNSSNQLELGANDIRPTRYVPIEPNVIQNIDPADTNWNDLDLTAITSARTFAVAVWLQMTSSAAGHTWAIRKNGETNPALEVRSQVASVEMNGFTICGTDTDQIVETRASTASITSGIVKVVGYFEYLD